MNDPDRVAVTRLAAELGYRVAHPDIRMWAKLRAHGERKGRSGDEAGKNLLAVSEMSVLNRR